MGNTDIARHSAGPGSHSYSTDVKSLLPCDLSDIFKTGKYDLALNRCGQ